ncbi:MAG: S9 family peptidase [Candidatus Dormibacteraeota bacterium]|nr:S9 family peptidase [Candidatus Dormibacteraeota bacterium]
MSDDVDALLTLSRAYLPLPDPAGGTVFAADLTGHGQVYRQAGPDRFPERLAGGRYRTLPVAHTPLGLLCRQDHDGDERWQLGFVEGARFRQVTRDDRAIHRDVQVEASGRSAIAVTNPDGQSDWVVIRIDLTTGATTRLLDRGGFWSCLGLLAGGEVVVAEHAGSLRNRAYVLDAEGGLRPLLPQARAVTAVCAAERCLVAADLGGGFIGLHEVDPAHPAEVVRTLFGEPHDVEAVVADPSGKRAALVVNAGAYDRLLTLGVSTGIVEDVTTPWPGVVYGDNVSSPDHQVAWLPDGNLLVAWESSTHPAELWELPVRPQGAAPRAWTHASGALPEGLVEPEEITVQGFQGLPVPALLFPSRAQRPAGAPRTTVVYFHGGPEGQTRGSFIPQLQMWLCAGYDVLAPNVRGSTGYGFAFAGLDDREKRWDAVRDGVALGRWVKDSGDADRLVAMGGSYGGFMTLAVLVEAPELWDAAVDVVGIADWHSFFRNTSGWRRAQRASEYGDPLREPDGTFLAEFSPLRRADRIRAQLLVIHGRNDPRVPVGEATQIAQAVPGSELLILEDEGHGIARAQNRSRAYGRALRFVTERVSA